MPVVGAYREQLQLFLKARGIETQVHYPIPPHQQRCFLEWNNLSFPVTEQISREELSLPCNEAMTEDEVCAVVEALNSFAV